MVAPAAGAAIGAGLGTVVGGLLSDRSNPYANIDIPTLQALIDAGKIDETAFDSISTDPATREAQIRALAELSNEGSRGGASIQSKAAQAQIMDAAATRERMNREAVLRDMSARGQAGGGGELAARLIANQEGARRDAASSAQIAGDDRTRALQALREAGALGGNVRAQDYGQARDKAAARDELARWNAQNRLGAYDRRMGWQFARAGGTEAHNNTNYNRNVNMGGAIGGMAGGVAGYAATGGTGGVPGGTATDNGGWAAPVGTGEAGTDGWGY